MTLRECWIAGAGIACLLLVGCDMDLRPPPRPMPKAMPAPGLPPPPLASRPKPAALPKPANDPSPQVQALARLKEQLPQIRPALVALQAFRGGKSQPGTGVLVDVADGTGLIATNFDLVRGARQVTAILADNTSLTTEGCVGISPGKDLAILRVGLSQAQLLAGKVSSIPLCAELEVGEQVAPLSNLHDAGNTAKQGHRTIASLRTLPELTSHEIEALSARGIDIAATWITLSGLGPTRPGDLLLNMQGELVGMFGFARGAVGGLAVSTADLAALITDCGQTNVAWGDLPHSSPTNTTPRGQLPVPCGFGTVRLSGEGEFAESSMLVTSSDLATWKKALGTGKLEVKTDNGQEAFVFGHKEGKLHRMSISRHSNQMPMVIVFFNEGRKEGPMRIWADDGSPVFFADFKKGKKHGLTCLFRRGLPCLVERHEDNKAQSRFTVSYRAGLPLSARIDPKNPSDIADPETAQAVQELAALELEMANGEKEIRAYVKEWYDNKIEAERRVLLRQKVSRERERRQAERNRKLDIQNREINAAWQRATQSWRTTLPVAVRIE